MNGLGVGGLPPFYASALWLYLPGAPGQALAADVFIIYGAVILAFLGGTLWGHAVVVSAPQKYRRLVVSNAVALFAAVAALTGSHIAGALLLALGQIGLLLYERAGAKSPGWYSDMRTRLTLAVLPAHAIFVIAAPV